jgi:hypothetical protein
MPRAASIVTLVLGFAFAAQPLSAMQLTPQQSELYTSVSTSPPTAETMTVCYGFVCRRRVELDFTAADRKTLTQIMAAGKASAVAERAAIQKAVLWFDKRMGPVIGTTTRVARADIRNRADASNYDCWDRPATSRACCWCCSNGDCSSITPSVIRVIAATFSRCSCRTIRR